MQHTLESFLKALRAHDVRVSPSEAIDAHRAAAEVGYGDRALLKDALCVTLAKSADEVDRFDACFDTFFARPVSPPSPRPPAGGASDAPPGSPQLA
ncbi:MAG: dehydrogenase/GMP reductase:VWA containing CoxE-like protein, partial [Caulobacteraceae bacterium]|nr:dehydrogenase/GMP reductase:VWA containing CoxE-like protein [Caulobacteraceae bacterium]